MKTWRSTGGKCYKRNHIYFFRRKIKHVQLLQLAEFFYVWFSENCFNPFMGMSPLKVSCTEKGQSNWPVSNHFPLLLHVLL